MVTFSSEIVHVGADFLELEQEGEDDNKDDKRLGRLHEEVKRVSFRLLEGGCMLAECESEVLGTGNMMKIDCRDL